MKLSDFDFELPDDRIALRPASPRDAARMLVVRPGEALLDRRVADLPAFLRAGDVMVFNDTKVIAARLTGTRERDGRSVAVEATLHRRLSPHRWSAFMRPGKRLHVGDRVRFGERDDRACLLGALDATVAQKGDGGEVTLSFDLSGPDLDAAIAERGVMPLPPYIAAKRAEDERDRTDYQTVYAREDGSVAAPTAGLHFTPDLLQRLRDRGVATHFVTLHVGAGTFLPVKVDDVAEHHMHPEYGEVTADTAQVAQHGPRRRRPCRLCRHHLAAAAGKRRRQGRRDRGLRRRDGHLHHPGLQIPRRRRFDDQLPPAPIDPVHAGQRVRGD